jgi:tetratricopeptide (TPR) repeat protein
MRAAFALALAAAGAAASSAKGATPTVLFVPFTVTGPREASWAALVAAEQLLQRAHAAPQINALSVRQLNTVLKRRDLMFEDLAAPELAARVGSVLGATHAVVGNVDASGDTWKLSASLVRIPGGAVIASASAESAERIEGAIAAVGDALFAALGVKGAAAPAVQSDPRAWIQTGRCLEAMLPQPLGPRARPSLAQDALAEAKAACEAAVALGPELALARAGLALLRVNEGDAKAGLAEAKAAQAREFSALGVLAEYYARMQLHEDAAAVAALEAAVKAQPGFLHARGYIGEHYNDHDEYAKALKAFEAYLARCPGHPWVMAQIGYSKARLGQLDESLKITREALARDPDNAEMAIELASRLIDAKRLDEAADALGPSLAADPPRPLAQLRLGYIRLLQGRLDEAEPPLRRALRDASREDEGRTRGFAHFDLARIYARQGKLEEAVLELLDSRAEGHPKKLSCSEPDLQKIAADKRFTEICTPDAKPAKKKR